MLLPVPMRFQIREIGEALLVGSSSPDLTSNLLYAIATRVMRCQSWGLS